jgi:hypothetical protein
MFEVAPTSNIHPISKETLIFLDAI